MISASAHVRMDFFEDFSDFCSDPPGSGTGADPVRPPPSVVDFSAFGLSEPLSRRSPPRVTPPRRRFSSSRFPPVLGVMM